LKKKIDEFESHTEKQRWFIYLLFQLLATEGRLKQSIETELSLRKVLDEYSGKYATLTQSFASSSTQFDKAKEQLGRMNGNLIKVQADARKWKDKADEASK
jgi:hypothetical protein